MKHFKYYLSFFTIIALVMSSLINSSSLYTYADSNIETPFVTKLYNDKSGLPTSEANTILQTSDGYIWIGSYSGLIRFDGTSFYNFSQTTENDITSVRTLFEDSKGRLWIGTNDAGVFYYENNSFHNIPSPSDHSFLSIRDFAETSDGCIYLASTSGIAYIEDDCITPVNDPIINNHLVYCLGVDSYDRIWGSYNNGDCVIIKDNKVLKTLAGNELFDDTSSNCISSDVSGNIYIGSNNNKVMKITFTNENLDTARFQKEVFELSNVNTLNSIDITKDGTILVCGQLGFGIISPDGSIKELNTEYTSSIESATMDYEENIWFASGNYGIIKLTKGSFNTPNAHAELDNIAVNTITGNENCYYLGTDNGLLIFDNNWNPISNSLTDLLSGYRVRQIYSAKDNTVWIATSKMGAIHYNPSSDTYTIFDSTNGLISSTTRTILEMQNGDIVIGTQEGLNIINNDTIIKSYGKNDGLENCVVLCLYEGNDGTLYYGSDGHGIYAIKDNTITNYYVDDGLTEGVVLRIYGDSDNDNLFISAGNSLYYWNTESFTKFTNFIKNPGSFYDIWEYDDKLWLSQSNGILCIDKESLFNDNEATTITYGHNYGLTGPLDANTWNYINDNNTLYLTTRNGISIFNFNATQHILPKLALNNVQIDGETIDHSSKIILSPRDMRISINIAALTYSGTSQTTLAYKLEGFDDEETIITDDNFIDVSYTNLPGGEYTFYVRIFDNFGNEDRLEIKITKKKAIYERLFFWISIVFISLLIILVLFFKVLGSKLNKERKQRDTYKQIVEQSLKTIANTIDAKDHYTNGHSLRVALYSRELSRRLGQTLDEQEHIYYVALLHDIGKIGIPDSILNKEGKLTDEERSVIQSHVTIGGQILKDFNAIEDIADGALYHHERYDGKGYCEQISGEQIPQVARIIGVADSYDAMSSDRCYRKALSKDIIIDELNKGTSTQFDPEIVPLMLEMISDGTADRLKKSAE